MDERKLRSLLVLRGVSVADFSDSVGVSRVTLWRKMKEGTFTQKEIHKIKNYLHLSDGELVSIFFCP